MNVTPGTSKDSLETTSQKDHLTNMKLNDTKAGMEGLDTEKINKIIQKVSEGSLFYQHKQKSQERLNVKIKEMKSAMSSLTNEQLNKATKEMDLICEHLERSRDLTRVIVHVDMDAFYAAVEMRDDPTLRDKPMAVGGNSMLSTSNYLARRFGIRAGMPGFIAKKLCPHLVIVELNFDKYRKVSKEVQEIFAEYDPGFSAMSLDEAYLDITDYLEAKNGDFSCSPEDRVTAEEVVSQMRARIQDKTKLTASAGIAPNTMLAKVCSDQNKPNGQFYLPPDKEAVMNFVEKLPIRKVSGIGNVSEQLLNAVGVVVCSDLYKQRGLLKLLFSEISYEQFMQISLGLGGTQVTAIDDRERKSISTERTFQKINEKKQLLQMCEELSNELAADMKKKKIVGKAVTLKLKTVSFEVKTKIHNLVEFTSDCEIIASTAKKILISEISSVSPAPLELRLMGVRMSNLCAENEVSSRKQITLDKMFQNIAPNVMQVQECPICGNIQQFSNMLELKKHVEECLRLSSAKDEERDGDNERGKDVTSKPDAKVTYTSLDPTVTCPVCSGKVSFESLNSHIDECLNRDVINELRGEIGIKRKRDDRSAIGNPEKKKNRGQGTLKDFFIKS